MTARRSVPASALGELELDPPVALEGGDRAARVDWLELAEPGGCEPVGRNPRSIRYLTTATARPVESSQFDG